MNKITVIIPVYNGEKVVRRAIQSLLHQSIFVDILVIDDGSKDGTGDLVKGLAKDHPNITYVYKENSGVADSRNLGMSLVRSEYFGFLDADDFVREDMYGKMLRKIEEDKSDICFCDFYWKYPGQERYQKDTGYKDRKEILTGMFAVLWNKLYRTSWFKATGLKCLNVGSDEDSSLLYRLAYHMEKVSYVEEPLVYYVQSDTSIKHTYNARVFGILQVLEEIKTYYVEKGAYEEFKEEIEYLTVRYLFGNSYLSACYLEDKQMRKEALHAFYDMVEKNCPDYRSNRYLHQGGKKNLYYRTVAKPLYFLLPPVFRLLNKTGIMK